MVRYGVPPVSERATIQIIQREMPLIDKLIELVTNSDDSYRRMGYADNDLHHPIDMIFYEGKNTGKHKSERSRLFVAVWDRSGEYLDDERLVKAFAYLGELIGDMAVTRGFWSRGVKQVLLHYGNEPEHEDVPFSSPEKVLPPLVLNFHAGKLRGFTYNPSRGSPGVPVDEHGKPRFLSERELQSYVKWVDKSVLKKLNDRWTLKGVHDERPGYLSKAKSGTFVCFVLRRTETRLPSQSAIYELESAWKLRKLEEKRVLRFTDANKSFDHQVISPRLPDAEESKLVEVVQTDLEYVDEQSKRTFPLHLEGKIYEASESLQQTGEACNHPTKVRGGVLILDDKDIPRDCTLFELNSEPLANRLFGEVKVYGFSEIHQFEERCMTGEDEGGTGEYPLTPYHELNEHHPLYHIIRQEITKKIRHFVESKRQELVHQQTDARWDSIKKPIIREINSVIHDINAETQRLQDLWFDPGYIDPDVGEVEEVAILFGREAIEKPEVNVSGNPSGLNLKPTKVSLTEDVEWQGPTGIERVKRGNMRVHVPESCSPGYYQVTGSCLDSYKNEYKAELTVAVGFEEELPQTLSSPVRFTKPGYTSSVSKVKKIPLLVQRSPATPQAPFIPPKSVVRVTLESGSQVFELMDAAEYVVGTDKSSVFITVVAGETPVYETKIKVKCLDSGDVLFKAEVLNDPAIRDSCTLKITTPSQRGFLRDIRFLPGTQPALRSYFDSKDRILYIYTDSYLLRGIDVTTQYGGGAAFMIFWDELRRQMAIYKLTKGRKAIGETVDENASEFRAELQEIEKKYVGRIKGVFAGQVSTLAKQSAIIKEETVRAEAKAPRLESS